MIFARSDEESMKTSGYNMSDVIGAATFTLNF